MQPVQTIVCHPSPLIGQSLARLLSDALKADAHFAVTTINDVFLALDQDPTLLVIQSVPFEPLIHEKTLALLMKHQVFTLVLTDHLTYDSSVDQRLIGHFAFMHSTSRLDEVLTALNTDTQKLFVSHRISILPTEPRSPSHHEELPDMNSELVRLLLSGQNDESIQTQLDLSSKQLNREKTKIRKLYDQKNDFFIGKELSKRFE